MNNNWDMYTLYFKSGNWYFPISLHLFHTFSCHNFPTDWLAGKLCWWARIIMWPLPRLSRWIRGWGSLCDPHFTTAVSPTAQLMPRYQQDNVIPVHRRHYCHADNGGGKWDRFQNCYVGCQSCPLLVSNICQMQIESAVFCSHRRLGKIGMGSASHGTGSLYSHCLALYS